MFRPNWILKMIFHWHELSWKLDQSTNHFCLDYTTWQLHWRFVSYNVFYLARGFVTRGSTAQNRAPVSEFVTESEALRSCGCFHATMSQMNSFLGLDSRWVCWTSAPGGASGELTLVAASMETSPRAPSAFGPTTITVWRGDSDSPDVELGRSMHSTTSPASSGLADSLAICSSVLGKDRSSEPASERPSGLPDWSEAANLIWARRLAPVWPIHSPTMTLSRGRMGKQQDPMVFLAVLRHWVLLLAFGHPPARSVQT